MDKYAAYVEGIKRACQARGIEPESLFDIVLSKVAFVPAPGSMPGGPGTRVGSKASIGPGPTNTGSKVPVSPVYSKSKDEELVDNSTSESPMALSRMYSVKGNANTNGNGTPGGNTAVNQTPAPYYDN